MLLFGAVGAIGSMLWISGPGDNVEVLLDTVASKISR